MDTIRRVLASDLDHLEAYAEVARQGSAEDFGALAQSRPTQEFLNQLQAGNTEYHTIWVSDEVVGTIETIRLPDATTASVYIRVLKAVQGYGLGQQALRFSIERLRAKGITTIVGGCSARSIRDNRNVRFLIKSGFEETLILLRQDIDLAAADRSAWRPQAPSGVRLAVVADGYELDVMDQVAALQHRHITEDPGMAPVEVDLHEGPELAALYRRLAQGGRRTVLSLALDESDRVIGYSKAQFSPSDRIAEQYATYVLPTHRGRGLTAALIGQLLTAVTDLAPAIGRLRVFVPAEVPRLAVINRRLGFTDTAYYREWELKL